MDQSHGRIYLFTIFGTRALSLEATRPVHNRVAGNPEDVAAALQRAGCWPCPEQHLHGSTFDLVVEAPGWRMD